MADFNTDIENSIVILLTATIVPNIQDLLAVKDPGTRKEQYLEAISYYINRTKNKIVFAENSNNSLAVYFSDNLDRIEFLDFNVDKGDNLVKGYNEMEIIQYAMLNSKFIKGARGILKITGRLQVLNINFILRTLEDIENKPLICNIFKKGKMDSRCFYFTKEFWPYLYQYKPQINRKFSFESALWKAIHIYKEDKYFLYQQFTVPLRIKGVSGGFGTAYKHNLFAYIGKMLLHQLDNYRVVPRINNS